VFSHFILPASAAVQTGIITAASTYGSHCVSTVSCCYCVCTADHCLVRSAPRCDQLLASRLSQSVSVLVLDQTRQDSVRVLGDTTHTVNMSNKAKTGGEDEEKQSPTDLQEIQLQMNATTDEVRACVCARPLIIIQQFINDITALSTECGCIYCRDENATGNEHRSAERIDVCIKPRLVHA